MLLARLSVIIISAFFFASFGHANEYFIDEYKFEWKVFSEGDLLMNIIKTEETTNVQLRSGDLLSRSLLRLTPDEAVKIGSVLEQTRAFFDQHKGTESDVSDRVQAGDYQISFRTSVKYGFSVTIRDPSLLSMNTFSLNRAQATKLQTMLMQVPEMVTFINEKVLPD